jgi:hypothetical protein
VLVNVGLLPRNTPFNVLTGLPATPPLESNGTFDKLSFKKNPTNGAGFLKPGRAIPPRVDVSAASRSTEQEIPCHH